jgi:NAD(P)-dependent dehydrogenase (short-subunit alcohol dehydrogenase family)
MNSQIALVTGASSGIGQACALALLKKAWRVALLARRTEGLGPWLQHHQIDPSLALILSADVSDETQVKGAFKTLENTFGRLDLLFNNAGIFPTGQLPDEVTGEAWRQAVEVNINGAFYCLSAAFSLMKRQSPMGGRIINNGSISAHAPRPASIAYTTTKHAITGLTKAANLDGRAFNIAVGQIDIGNVASDMTQAMAQGILQADGSVKSEARMDMQGVVDTVMNMAQLPLSANVLFTTIMATGMPFVGRG